MAKILPELPIDIDNISGNNELEDEIRSVLKRHCQENLSNTPDHILSEYLLRCLDNFNAATVARDIWYGKLNRE